MALVYFVCPTTWTLIVTQKSEEGKFFGPGPSIPRTGLHGNRLRFRPIWYDSRGGNAPGREGGRGDCSDALTHQTDRQRQGRKEGRDEGRCNRRDRPLSLTHKGFCRFPDRIAARSLARAPFSTPLCPQEINPFGDRSLFERERGWTDRQTCATKPANCRVSQGCFDNFDRLYLGHMLMKSKILSTT